MFILFTADIYGTKVYKRNNLNLRIPLLLTFLRQSRSPAVVASNSGSEDADADAGDGAERFATGKKGGASSENVVDKKDVLACKRVRGHFV